MIKLFERIFWHNNTTPAIDEDNLNAMSKAINDIDDRVIELGADVMEVVPQIQAYLAQADDLVEAMENLSKNPPYIGANGNWYVWDTETSAYVDSGVDASITVRIADITMLATGATPYVTNTGTDTDPIFHLFIPQGKYISNIAKSATSGLTDTYTITYSDSTTTTFNVVNGNGIASIVKASTSGLVDTYTITFQDATTTTFSVTNGRGIVSIEKTETVGYTDTYTITYNDNTTSQFYVHNGKSGSGSNITVTTSDPELFGRPVTITDGYGRTETQNFNSSGVTRFDSVEFSGQVTVSSSTAGGYSATNTLTLTYFGNYSTQLSLWRAVVNITSPSELYGASVVVKDSNNVTVDTVTLDALDGTGTFQTFDSGTYTFSYTYHGYTYTETLALTSSGTFSLAITKKATVSITSDADIYGYSVVVKNSSNVTVDTVTLDPLDGTASVILFETGTFTFNFVYDGDAYDESITVVAGTTSYSVELSPLTIVTWANGTDSEIAKMLEAHYKGKINIYDYWSIGDERIVDLTIPASDYYVDTNVVVGRANSYTITTSQPHRSYFPAISTQSITLVLMDKDTKTLQTPYKGHTKGAFVVGMKNILPSEYIDGYTANNYDTQQSAWGDPWSISARRLWCNGVFKDAFPTFLKTLLKSFLVVTPCVDSLAAPNGDIVDTYDYIAPFTTAEYFGNDTSKYKSGIGSSYNQLIGSASNQFEYFQTASNRQAGMGSGQESWIRDMPYRKNDNHHAYDYSPYSDKINAIYFNTSNFELSKINFRFFGVI